MYDYPRKPKNDKNYLSPEKPVLSRALLFFAFWSFLTETYSELESSQCPNHFLGRGLAFKDIQ